MVIDGLAGYYKRRIHVFQPGVAYENFADDEERLVVTGETDATLEVETSRHVSEDYTLYVSGISDDDTWVTLFSGTTSSLPKTFTGYRIYNFFTPNYKIYMTFTVTY